MNLHDKELELKWMPWQLNVDENVKLTDQKWA